MPEVVIKPSTKLIQPFYWLSALMAVAVLILSHNASKNVLWLLVLPGVIFLWAAARHFRRNFTRLIIAGDRLRYESGIVAKSTRTLEIRKVQDVRVDQSLFQRMVGIGNLSIETAGEASRLTIEGIDQPQQMADQILDIAHSLAKGPAA